MPPLVRTAEEEPETEPPPADRSWPVMGVAVVVVGIVLLGLASGLYLWPVVDADDDPDPGPDTALSGEHEAADANVTIEGETANGTLGTELVGAVDVTGNGYDGLLVGAPSDDRGGENAGAIYLFSGPIENEELTASDADAVFVGESSGDIAGMAIAAGDLTGDGHDDIVIGAPANDTEYSNAGAAYVIHGGEEFDGEQSLAHADSKLAGIGNLHRAGESVAVLETATDDAGYVAVGAPRYHGAGDDAGGVFLFRGDELSDDAPVADADGTLLGAEPGDQAGTAIAGVDLAGDGTPSLVVGAPYHNGTGAHAGVAYVVDGEALDEWRQLHRDEADVREIHGVGENDRLGWTVAGTGSEDENGTEDVLVAAPWNDTTGPSAGSIYRFAEDDLDDAVVATAANTTIRGEGGYDYAGWSVVAIPSADANCTERTDVLVGSPGATAAGSVYLVGGDADGETSLGDSAATVRGSEDGDRFGTAVADGELTGSGTGDLVVAAPNRDTGEENAGTISVFEGACSVEEHSERGGADDESEGDD